MTATARCSQQAKNGLGRDCHPDVTLRFYPNVMHTNGPPLKPREEFRKLPSVDALLREPGVALLAAEYGQAPTTDAIRDLLNEARDQIGKGQAAPATDGWLTQLDRRLRARNIPSLRPVINASGIIIHTNLGRAPLSEAARRAISEVAAGYSNLEYDLDAGQRGNRHEHPRAALRELTGAEDALVVNNAAAALVLTLTALCLERALLISRSELVEIGGGFRIPDVLRQSGATLHEVGTTNRTHLRDFAEPLAEDIDGQIGAVLRVHSSNFRQIGFVTMPERAELAELVRKINTEREENWTRKYASNLFFLDDIGSGALLDTAQYGLAPEPTVQASLEAGADVVIFSGDKLLGGPQAGIILGRAEPIAALRRHPLARALRVDKLALAALEATLRSYRAGRAAEEIPVWQMISAEPESLLARASAWREKLIALGVDAARLDVATGESAVGGGSLPGETLPSHLLTLAVDAPDGVATRLRAAPTPIVCRIQHGRLTFDPRTVIVAQEAALLEGMAEALR